MTDYMIQSGIRTDGGYVVELEGDVLAASPDDLSTQPDRSGRRWITVSTLMNPSTASDPGLGGKSKLAGLEEDIQSLLERILRKNGEDVQIGSRANIIGLMWSGLGKKTGGKALSLIIKDLRFLPKVIEYDRYQPEFYEDTSTYIGKRTNNKKVNIGLKTYKKNTKLIKKVEKKFSISLHFLFPLRLFLRLYEKIFFKKINNKFELFSNYYLPTKLLEKKNVLVISGGIGFDISFEKVVLEKINISKMILFDPIELCDEVKEFLNHKKISYFKKALYSESKKMKIYKNNQKRKLKK